MIMVWFCNQLKLKAMDPYEMYGMEQILLSVVFPIVVLELIQLVEQVHQVEFVVFEEQ